MLAGAAAGFVEDALSQQLLGMNAFAKAILGYGLTIVAVRVVFGGALAVGAALAVASLANEAIVALLGALLLQAPIVVSRATRSGAPWRRESRPPRSRRRGASRGASGGSGGGCGGCGDSGRKYEEEARDEAALDLAFAFSVPVSRSSEASC